MSAVTLSAGAAMLVLGLLLPLRRRAGARIVAAQGGLLALAAASAAWAGGGAGPRLWLLALGAFAGRALFLPALLRLGAAADETPPAPGGIAARLLLVGGAAVLAVAAIAAVGAGAEPGTRAGLALALATLLTGLLAMLLRRGMSAGLLGLLAAENGALLGLVHAGDALGGAAVLAVLSPGLVACVVLALRGRGGDGGGALSGVLPWAPRR